jgi:hypothetical protein
VLPGPPWGLRGVYWNLIAQGGDGRVTDEAENGHSTSINPKFVREVYIKPDRSYKQGRETDMLSIWRKV